MPSGKARLAVRTCAVRTPGTKEVLERLRALRKERGLRQESVARSLGIDRTTYVRKERGAIPITTEEWIGIARTLSVDAVVFFEAKGNAQKARRSGDAALIALMQSLTGEETGRLLKALSETLAGVRRKKVKDALKALMGA